MPLPDLDGAAYKTGTCVEVPVAIMFYQRGEDGALSTEEARTKAERILQDLRDMQDVLEAALAEEGIPATPLIQTRAALRVLARGR